MIEYLRCFAKIESGGNEVKLLDPMFLQSALASECRPSPLLNLVNAYFPGCGDRIGVAYVLLDYDNLTMVSREFGDTRLILKQEMKEVNNQEETTIINAPVVPIHAICVVPHSQQSKRVYLLVLGDATFILDRRTLYAAYNVRIDTPYDESRNPANPGMYFYRSLKDGSVWTWNDLINDLADKANAAMPGLSLNTTLPVSPVSGRPSFYFQGISVWKALCQVCACLGCFPLYDVQQNIIRIVQKSASNAQRRLVMWSNYPYSSSQLCGIPDAIYVSFPIQNAGYGQEYELSELNIMTPRINPRLLVGVLVTNSYAVGGVPNPRHNLGAVNVPSFYMQANNTSIVDNSPNQPYTSIIIEDDTPAYIEDGSFLAVQEIRDRAIQVATNWVREYQYINSPSYMCIGIQEQDTSTECGWSDSGNGWFTWYGPYSYQLALCWSGQQGDISTASIPEDKIIFTGSSGISFPQPSSIPALAGHPGSSSIVPFSRVPYPSPGIGSRSLNPFETLPPIQNPWLPIGTKSSVTVEVQPTHRHAALSDTRKLFDARIVRFKGRLDRLSYNYAGKCWVQLANDYPIYRVQEGDKYFMMRGVYVGRIAGSATGENNEHRPVVIVYWWPPPLMGLTVDPIPPNLNTRVKLSIADDQLSVRARCILLPFAGGIGINLKVTIIPTPTEWEIIAIQC